MSLIHALGYSKDSNTKAQNTNTNRTNEYCMTDNLIFYTSNSYIFRIMENGRKVRSTTALIFGAL